MQGSCICTCKCEKQREEMNFSNYVNKCLMEIGRGSRIVLIGDINGRVSSDIAGVVGKWSVDRVYESGEYLMIRG